MEVKELEKQVKRDFNISISLIGVLPFLVFLYILYGRMSAYKILLGEVGNLVLIASALMLLGIITGRRMLWKVIQRIFDYHRKILELQDELVKKSRVDAVSETTLALCHEINNPLMVILNILDLLQEDFIQQNIGQEIRERTNQIKANCERINQATKKLASLTNPVSTTIHGDIRMIDLSKSE